jgi:hypothetical protein
MKLSRQFTWWALLVQLRVAHAVVEKGMVRPHHHAAASARQYAWGHHPWHTHPVRHHQAT